MKKLAVSIIMIIVLGVAATVVYATPIDATVSDMNSSVVTISGQIPDIEPFANVTIGVLYPNQTIKNLEDCYSKDNIKEVFNSFVQVRADENGNYSKNIKFTGGKGFYMIRVSAQGVAVPYEYSYYYATKQDKINIIKEINAKEDGAALVDYLDIENPVSEPLMAFSLYSDLLQTINTEQFGRILYKLNKQNPASAEDLQPFITSFRRALVMQQLNDRTLTDISKYMELLELDNGLVVTYNTKLIDSKTTNIVSALYGKDFMTLDEVNREFGAAVILFLLNNKQSWADVNYIIEKHHEFLGISSSGMVKYEKLKDKGGLALVLGGNYGRLSDFISDFEKQVVSRYDIENSDSVDRGKSAPKSSSAGTASVPPPALDAIAPVKKVFVDLPASHWAYNYVSWLADNNIVGGADNNKFEPDRTVTREEFIKILVQAFDIRGTGNISFSDVDASGWYYEYIVKAAAAGIVRGYENGAFGIGESISRADAAVMICRVLKEEEDVVKNTEKFEDDGSIPSYARNAVYYLREKGIISGLGANSFAPSQGCTRAECAKIMFSVLEGGIR